MKYLRLRFSFVFLFLLVFKAHTSAATHGDMVEKYISQSGLGEMLVAIPGQIDTLASQNTLTSKHPDVDKKVFQLMKESFDVKQAEKTISNYLLRNTDKIFLGEMLKWLESPLAQKITKEEINSSGAENQGDMLRYLAELESNPPAQERITLIQGVEQATHLSELTANILLDIMKGMVKSVNSATADDKSESINETLQEIESAKPAIQESFRQQMILTSFYVYRNISDDELNAYIKFYESELGQKEISVTGAALGHALKLWFDEIGNKLIIWVKEESGKCDK